MGADVEHGEVVMVGTVQQVRLPRVGDPASLVPEDVAAAPVDVHVLSTEGGEPAPVRVTLDTPAPDAEAVFHGDHVWLAAAGQGPGGAARTWFSASATTLPDDDRVVLLDHLVLAAVETRRESVRAPLPGQATMETGSGHGRIAGTLVDISPGGCRVSVPGWFLPQVGATVDLVATLEAGLLVHTACSVVRIDDRTPTEIGLRFVDLPREAATRLEREVLRAAQDGILPVHD